MSALKNIIQGKEKLEQLKKSKIFCIYNKKDKGEAKWYQ